MGQRGLERRCAHGSDGGRGYAQTTLRYQFVAFDTANQVLARSQVYSDVTLGTCP